eukprot:2312081-Rhodomonas_salina.1
MRVGTEHHAPAQYRKAQIASTARFNAGFRQLTCDGVALDVVEEGGGGGRREREQRGCRLLPARPIPGLTTPRALAHYPTCPSSLPHVP